MRTTKAHILVTGDKGFIGSHLTKKLKNTFGFDLKDGHDILDREVLEEVFKSYKPEIVIHLAAKTGVPQSWSDRKGYYETNIIGTQNVIDMCDKYKVKKLVYASSSSIYTDTPYQSPYGLSKQVSEQLFFKIKTPYTILRFFTVYGPRGRCVISKFFEAMKNGQPLTINGDGKQKRYFTYVADVVDCIIRAIFVKEEVLDVRSEELKSIEDVLCELERVLLVKADPSYFPCEEKGVYAKLSKSHNFNLLATSLCRGIELYQKNYNLN